MGLLAILGLIFIAVGALGLLHIVNVGLAVSVLLAIGGTLLVVVGYDGFRGRRL